MVENNGYKYIIEEKIFRRQRFVPDLMQEYGFELNVDGTYTVRRDFMDGDFTAVISVDRSGRISASVIDNMNSEEYVQLRSLTFSGAYVNTVRSVYEDLLRDIAERCCRETVFAGEQSNRIAELIQDEFGVPVDHPWAKEGIADTYGVFRHRDSGKWFALIMDVQRDRLDKNKDPAMVDIINLKADEKLIPQLHKEVGIYPAWHMNHRTWISVLLDDTLSDESLMELVTESFRLTGKRPGGLSEALIHEVLEIADSVPAGRVVSYGQIAKMAGREKNARLVGKIMSMADRYGEHPCHRVVNSAGRTVPGWKEQRALLEAEGVGFKENGCVDMSRYRWKREEEK